MWLSNDNSHVCGESFVADGACCCNCKHLKKYVVDGVVVGHYDNVARKPTTSVVG